MLPPLATGGGGGCIQPGATRMDARKDYTMSMDEFSKTVLENAAPGDLSEYGIQSSTEEGQEESETEAESTSEAEDAEATESEETEENESEEEDSEEEDGEDDEESQSDSAKKNKDVDFVYATGPKGRQKIKIDYSNKDQVKKAFQKATAGDLWRVQRDNYKKQVDDYEPDASKFRTLDKAWQVGGLVELARTMAGGGEQLEAIRQQAIDEYKAFTEMTPEEQAQYQADQKVHQSSKEVENLRARLREIEDEKRSATEKAEIKEMEALVNPVYEKYSFSGQLEDEEDEYSLNKLLWDNASKEVDELPDTVALTTPVVNDIFKRHAAKIRRMMNMQAKKKVEKAEKKRKAVATKAAQTAVSKKIGKKSPQTAMQEALSRNDFGAVLDHWFIDK